MAQSIIIFSLLLQLLASAGAFQTAPTLRYPHLSASVPVTLRPRRQSLSSGRTFGSQNEYTEKEERLAPLSPTSLIDGAEKIILEQQQQQQSYTEACPKEKADAIETTEAVREIQEFNTAASRRMILAAATIGLGSALGATVASVANAETTLGNLKWEATPVNKRTGVTVFDAEKDGYNVAFVTYLSRFLLCFDEDCQRWWYSKASDIPRLSKKEEIEAIRLQQFASFSASVEVGLQFYRGAEGVKRLLASLLKRYCPDLDSIRGSRLDAGLPTLGESAEAEKLREIKEARRQVAILFGLMEKNQPVDEISSILAAIDNGSIATVDINDEGAGYAPGYGAPFVMFPKPDGGPDYETAIGRAVLVPNGKILRLDVINRGSGYAKPPTVTIEPPEAAKIGNGSGLKAAEGRAILFSFGANKGRVERIVLTDPGLGYTEKEIIKVRLTPPESEGRNGVTATATAVLEYKVGDIMIVNGGSGYAVEKPIDVYVEAPPPTARVNMNDPMIAQMLSADKLLPTTTIPTKDVKKKMADTNDPTSAVARIQRLAMNEGKGGAGGCVGRACYDHSVEAIAYARAAKNSYSSFRTEDDATKSARMEANLMNNAGNGSNELVSGSTSGIGNAPRLPGFGVSSSVQLLSLLPEGIGLQYDREKKRYLVRATSEVLDKLPDGLFDGSSMKPRDPEFGPRGRSPIEREKELGLNTYLRFVASGAICCSGVHLALTPIDVVKTKVQSNPIEYPNVFVGFQKVLADGGPSGFFTGWVPTFIGFFIWGGQSYALNEYLRRLFAGLAGIEASNLEVPIILAASAISATGGAFILCPFEAVRIRSVALAKERKSIFDILNKMLADEGWQSLFAAVPAFLAKEIPFNTAKFLLFDLSTAAMYDAFPVAREDLQLSLLVSLAGGTLGGVVAAVVSNPADATITEMKKAKSDRGPLETAQMLIEEGGPSRLFAGVFLRMVFYSLVVSLQFLVYDAVRFALGIGADDLKLYLDVLGGALTETGGPV